MPKKKTGSDSVVLPDGNFPFPVGTDAYFHFLKHCIEIDPLYNEGDLQQLGGYFSSHSARIQREINSFKRSADEYSLMSVILLWAQWVSNDKVFGDKYLAMMEDLLRLNLVEHKHPLDGKSVNIAEFATWNPRGVVDAIRCHQDWSIEKREDYVKFFVEFSVWLSNQTFGLVPKAEDRDRAITAQRKLPFDTYIAFLKHLDLRERIMTKIFYLGGSMGLEEVLSLEVKDIDFNAYAISFSGETVHFPEHVFEDLKTFLEGRKKGYVFIGKSNERINHTVPYRSLKAVATKLGMSSSFTFRDFVKNQ